MLNRIHELKPDGTKSVTYGDSSTCNGAFGPRTPINVSIIDVEVEAARCLRGVCRALNLRVPLKSVAPRLIAMALLRHNGIEALVNAEQYVLDELDWLDVALMRWHYNLTGRVADDCWLPMSMKQAITIADLNGVDIDPETYRHSDIKTYVVDGAVLVSPVDVAHVLAG